MKKPYTAPVLEKLGLARVKNQQSIICANPHREVMARVPVSDNGIAYAQPVDCLND